MRPSSLPPQSVAFPLHFVSPRHASFAHRPHCSSSLLVLIAPPHVAPNAYDAHTHVLYLSLTQRPLVYSQLIALPHWPRGANAHRVSARPQSRPCACRLLRQIALPLPRQQSVMSPLLLAFVITTLVTIGGTAVSKLSNSSPNAHTKGSRLRASHAYFTSGYLASYTSKL